MKFLCSRCWERNCRCPHQQQERDRQKIIADFAKSEGLPEGWQPGQGVDSSSTTEKKP